MFRVNLEYLSGLVSTFVRMFGLYATWIFVHYIAAHCYVHWCVPATLIGFMASPFLVPSPHCQALRWAIYNGGNSINATWFLLGIWSMKQLTVVKTNAENIMS